MAAQKPHQEQLCPRLTKAEVGVELLTDRYNSQSLPKNRIGLEAQDRAHTRIWIRQGRSWQPKNLAENNFVLG